MDHTAISEDDCKEVAENGLKFFTTLKQKPGRETIIAAACSQYPEVLYRDLAREIKRKNILLILVWLTGSVGFLFLLQELITGDHEASSFIELASTAKAIDAASQRLQNMVKSSQDSEVKVNEKLLSSYSDFMKTLKDIVAKGEIVVGNLKVVSVE